MRRRTLQFGLASATIALMMRDQQRKEFLLAYGQAAEVLEAERIAWLSRLMPDEAKALYDSLCLVWESHESQAVGLDRLEPLILERLIRVRRAFEQMAACKGLL